VCIKKQWLSKFTGLRTAYTERGYVSLFLQHVQGADTGVDFDFLVGGSGGAPVLHGNH
jgi:hypothetical protein